MKRGMLFKLLLPLSVFFLLSTGSALAEEMTFEVTQDTFANSVYNPPLDYRDKNYGYTGSVVVSNDPIDRLGYFDFKNVDLPEGAVIDQVLFRFYVQNANSTGGIKLNIGPVTENWEEMDLTWNNKPAINQTLAVETEIGDSTGWKEVNVTTIITKWNDGSLIKKGLFVYPYGFLYSTAESDFAFEITSKEAADNHAELLVSYSMPQPTATPTPEPEPEEEEEVEEAEVAPEPEEEIVNEDEIEPVVIGLGESNEEADQEEATPSFPIKTKDLIIGAICVLLALLAGIVFSFAFMKDKDKKKKKEKPADPEE